MKNGFGSEALFHIAVELQQAMPAVLTRTELIDVVAFKVCYVCVHVRVYARQT